MNTRSDPARKHTPADRFDTAALARVLADSGLKGRFRVAFSGGADSTALLHALSRLRDRFDLDLSAIHVHHGLHPDADQWLEHCRQACRQWDVPLTHQHVVVDSGAAHGLEAGARHARYAAIVSSMQAGDIVLTAHHCEDQAETLLLNLARGCGLQGLAGMPSRRPLGPGWLWRPLLDFSQTELLGYLARHELRYLQDPSNEDARFDRNYLRLHVLPMLEERWPGIGQRMARSAEFCREASAQLGQEAQRHLGIGPGIPGPVMPISSLAPGSGNFAMLTRHWLRRHGAPAPARKRLLELERQLLSGRINGSTSMHWAGWMINVFDHALWLQREDRVLPCKQQRWAEPGPLNLGACAGRLEFHGSKALPSERLEVRRRSGGERIRCLKDGNSRKIKDILRESGIPPWMRPSVPILFDGDEAIAVADLVLSIELEQWLGSNSAQLRWIPGERLLRQLVTSREVDRPVWLR